MSGGSGCNRRGEMAMPHRRHTPCALNPVFEPMEARLLLDGTPLITEFMAINGSTLADSGGVYSD